MGPFEFYFSLIGDGGEGNCHLATITHIPNTVAVVVVISAIRTPSDKDGTLNTIKAIDIRTTPATNKSHVAIIR